MNNRKARAAGGHHRPARCEERPPVRPPCHTPPVCPFQSKSGESGVRTPKPAWAGKSRPTRTLPTQLRALVPQFKIESVRVE